MTQANLSPSDVFPEIEAIVDNLPSAQMLELSNMSLDIPLKECCKARINSFLKNVVHLCIETKRSLASWKKERQFRITGSRCYQLQTYSKNKNPDWQQKSLKYFYPKEFTNKYVRHGLENEPLARQKYRETTKSTVIECGLVISIENPWIGYTPDGIIFDDKKPVKLLEIKCPFAGKISNIYDIVQKEKYITIDSSNNISLKTKHAYYSQVQFGMAVLNLKQTDFVLYSSYDQSIIILPIMFDAEYAKQLLSTLKIIYFNNMLHYICQKN